MSKDECVKILLLAQAAHDRKMEELSATLQGFATWDYSFLDVLDLCLDMLGVPSDNTVETRACDIANETGTWPAGAFCRDSCYDTFDEMAVEKGDVDGFIAVIKDCVNKWAKEGIVR